MTVSRTRERRPVPLHLITGRAPTNCRAEMPDDDLDGLAASIDAIGLIQPLLVSAVPGPLLKFWVDDGGRRLAALRALAADGRLPADAAIDCDVLIADEGTAREISLAANVMRRDLHPVDQCAAFEAMRASGLSDEKIAADFAITVRQVRQRLRLTTLSPKVRAAWRDGIITLEAAQAFTLAPSHDAQDAYLADIETNRLGYAAEPRAIRARFLNNTVPATIPAALYVGLDAYREAGGTVEDNLFEDFAMIRDPELLNRLCRRKMMREGEALLQETGYGFCVPDDEIEYGAGWRCLEADYLAAESARLEEIEDNYVEIQEGETPDEELARRVAQHQERHVIEARAMARGNGAILRAMAGLALDLDVFGRLTIRYGVLAPENRRQPESDASDISVPSPQPTPVPAVAAKPDPIEAAASGHGVIRAILDETIVKAIAGIVSRRPDIALMIFVARHGATWRCEALAEHTLSPHKPALADGILSRTSGRGFDEAVSACANTSLNDLTVAFSTIVGHTLRLSPHATLVSLTPLMQAIAARGGALKPALLAALDHDRYFEAATKAACLSALDAMSAAAIDRQAKKPLLAAMAADEARKTEWLPFPLAGWAAFQAVSPEAHDEGDEAQPAPSLAAAMDEAIEADEADKGDLRRFLERMCAIDPAGKVKAGSLHDLFKAEGRTIGPRAFGEEIASLGIEKKRTKDGVFYLGIALKEDAR